MPCAEAESTVLGFGSSRRSPIYCYFSRLSLGGAPSWHLGSVTRIPDFLPKIDICLVHIFIWGNSVLVYVCPRIASRLCRTTRRTCGITKQNENSCITKKYHNKHLPPPSHNHSLGAWETWNTFIKHTNKISTLTQSHTHQKSKCEKMDSNTGMYGVDYCHDFPWSDIKFTLRGKALL